ncbi:MAG: SPASM domain-containing protein [Desulfovibrionaceae bacterium]|nr:SPASM domain-containing protein [Desulfovibrionaceae bacterium]
MIRKIWNLGIDVVHGCQLRCVGCPNSLLKPKIYFMSPADFDACLRNVDVRIVRLLRLFNFGEPLLHPDLPGILELIPRQSFETRQVHLSTNAQHRDFKKLEAVFRTGLLYRLSVSCDGEGRPEEYEALRPPAKWEVLVEFLRRAAEFRDAYSPHTRLETCTICETGEGRGRWLELLEPLGWEPRFRTRQKFVGARDFDPAGVARVPEEPCEYVQIRTLYVDTDGSVVPCCRHPRAAVFGNLLAEPYSRIYRGEKRRAFVRRLKTERRSMPICGQCDEPAHVGKLGRWLRKIVGPRD